MEPSTLYQLAIKAFVRHLKPDRAPICKFHDLPSNILCDVFDEMSSHSSLVEITHHNLSDPVLYMRVFMLNNAARRSLEQSVRKTSRNGNCALSDMAKIFCKLMSDEEEVKRYPSLATDIQGALELGAYLHDVGWTQLSTEVLYIARRMIPQDNVGLKIECLGKILRAEGSALHKLKVEETCSTLLTMVDDTTDDAVRIKVFLEVANHHFKASRFSEIERWIFKALQLITETTPPAIVIELLQLKALYLFHSRRTADAHSLFRQAIDRARVTFGHHHRRYADTLYTYGTTLVNNRYFYDIDILLKGTQMLIEVLIIITTLYGKESPRVNDIHCYLALGFNRLVKATGRIDKRCSRLRNTISVAELVMCHHGMSSHFNAVRSLILRRPYEFLDTIGNSGITGQIGNVSSTEEIKVNCFEMSEKFHVSEQT